jgi:uncharacterized protein (TIGR00297 family)
MWLMLLSGFIGSSIIAIVALRLKSLSTSGALAAIGVGTILCLSSSVAWFGTLIIFFISSSILSRWRKRDKLQTDSVYEKGSRRDAGQVLANGGLAAILCIGHAVLPHQAWWYAFVGVLATVTADTWATEVGSLSRLEPRFILSLKRVPRGTSGAVSILGSVAGAVGALVIGVAAVGLSWIDGQLALTSAQTFLHGTDLNVIWIAAAAGFLGALTDSIIGATVQSMRICSTCGQEVERAYHCKAPTDHLRGWSWMNNDAVNMISSIVGGLISVFIWLFGYIIVV